MRVYLPALPALCWADALLMGETRRDSTRIRGLYTWGQDGGVRTIVARTRLTFCLEKPGSITNTTPSMVREVSAILVDTTTLQGKLARFLQHNKVLFEECTHKC